MSFRLSSIQNKELRSFISFFITALLGAGTNFISQIPYKNLFLFLGMNDMTAYPWSVAAGYLTATVVSFIPAKLYAFSEKDSGSTRRESVKFLLISLVGFVIQLTVSTLTLNLIANPLLSMFSLVVREKVSHTVGMGVSFLANYLGHRFLTFRSTGIYDKIRPNRD